MHDKSIYTQEGRVALKNNVIEIAKDLLKEKRLVSFIPDQRKTEYENLKEEFKIMGQPFTSQEETKIAEVARVADLAESLKQVVELEAIYKLVGLKMAARP